MESVDLNVLKRCKAWMDEGLAVVLVTVLRTWGSSPRPPGSMMAMREDGAVAGSVSGGCIEDDLIYEMRQHGIPALCPEGVPALRKYGVRAEDARKFGLPCGGTMELVLEPVAPHSAIPELIERLNQRQAVARNMDMATGRVTLSSTPADLPPFLSDGVFSHAMGPRYRMIVIGAGQLSRYLCEVAMGLDFDILVCDPRKEYVVDWNLPEVPVTHDMPDDVVLEAKPDVRTAVVALTHDPKLDDLALMHALQSDAFYVAALGSRRNNAARVERLRDYFDLSEEELARLRGPAGVYIGSKTPSEIAISILAELIAAKNGVSLPSQLRVEEGKALHRQAMQESVCLIDPSAAAGAAPAAAGQKGH